MATYIPVITREYSRKVILDEILYIEQRQRKLAIVTAEDTYICYERIENLEKFLDERFYRTLKKMVINLDKIMVAQNQKITFVDGTVLTMGRESYIRTKQRFSAYLRNLI
ncbi:MAG: LytTR family transcriptional regulator DNA-binding domain-containing protein [Firmicutes bacterium]|nr:LytTR family transcriptional regulator DNA-binding domain-containing protein [Bacillota bacterium]